MDLCVNNPQMPFSDDIETLLDGNDDHCYTGKTASVLQLHLEKEEKVCQLSKHGIKCLNIYVHMYVY